jgi:RNA polymerase sigma-70 factor (ECF subfamily)
VENASDLELVDLARDGSEAAFEEIVRRYGPRVFSVASRFFRQRAHVEEAAQEAFLRAYTQLGAYEGRGSFEGWLTRITTNVCLNILRSAKRRPEALIGDLTDEEAGWIEKHLAASSERQNTAEDDVVAADLAEKVLGTMSPDDRTALTLVDGDQLSIKEVAEATGWSEAKVKTQTYRARRRMREAVEQLLGYRRKDT